MEIIVSRTSFRSAKCFVGLSVFPCSLLKVLTSYSRPIGTYQAAIPINKLAAARRLEDQREED